MTPTRPEQGFIKKHILAFRYFPDAPTKRAASDNLARAINHCTPLRKELSRYGYRSTDKHFTPKQVKLIYDYLGEPFAI